ncbi:gametogenetin-binding protein 2-like [Gigantopelta aegis]|uniref:gametogenetin-binding protein 2-like n=1 Tax=Gigantopelta aegis TaxID=1735272 RepID=UPI001B888307|nr:gametogenetin-binding protein 2-like [Gigantopelta aegis]
MARLVAVCRSDEYKFERRQIPLTVESLTMVIQFNEKCIDCEYVCGIKQKELEHFVQRFDILTKDELAVALMVTSKDIMNQLTHMVTCVGCRRSVERLFSQLVESRHPALEPLLITSRAELSLKHEYLFDPRALYALFYIHGSKLNNVMESIPKSKKNKRCNLHSLETHKTKTPGLWSDVWELLSQDCRKEVVLIDAESLLDTLNTYLRKHRFCGECKSKVHLAYSILVGEKDSTKEKGYCARLYENLRCCPKERHVHVVCDTEFIAHLIEKAEPELVGNRRDRHAKTLDIAQEEVLTCLGIHIYDRLHQIGQKLRSEEQTWQILFYLGVDTLKKSFEMAFERKQGASNLELICEELLEEERQKEQRREQKRQKRKKKKAKNQLLENMEKENQENQKTDENVHCQCHPGCTEPLSTSHSLHCDNHVCGDAHFCPHSASSLETCKRCDDKQDKLVQNGSCRNIDFGYSSGADGCESCSVPSSNEGSDIACSDGICTHEGGECVSSLLTDSLDSCSSCLLSSSDSPKHSSRSSSYQFANPRFSCCSQSAQCSHSDSSSHSTPSRQGMCLSLQDMLEEPCSSEEDGNGISEEDIQMFKANQKMWRRKREELRETLRQRFEDMQLRGGPRCSTEEGPDGAPSEGGQ